MIPYYAKRANEYERIYSKPERQKDLVVLRTLLAERARGLDLLEVACGTGYWTHVASRSARSIVATDCNEDVLSLARKKGYGACKVQFLATDAYHLDEVTGRFSGALLGFWWSHIPRSAIARFLQTLHSKLAPGARILVFDNRYVEGSSTPISRTDSEGNTYQQRSLLDGSRYEVLKNFPTRKDLAEHIAPFAERLDHTRLDYYWLAECTLRMKPEEGDAPPDGRSTSRDF